MLQSTFLVVTALLRTNRVLWYNVASSSLTSKHLFIPYSGKVWRRESLANSLVMSVWRGKVWRMHRFSHKVIIISKNLNGFSLANHGRFAKFAKLSPRQTFPLYGIWYDNIHSVLISKSPKIKPTHES